MNNFNRNLCIVNEQDIIIGTDKTITAHLRSNLKLHRAFSVFIFNSAGELLLQKRANEKLVYPSCWTNTCCSHPFINNNSFKDPIGDCRNHAIERLKYELGIMDVNIEDLVFVDRMLYYANGDNVNGRMIGKDVMQQERCDFMESPSVRIDNLERSDFGEFEVDYLFFCVKDVECVIRKSEVEEIEYVGRERFGEVVGKEMCSPWMKLIADVVDIFDMYEKINKHI